MAIFSFKMTVIACISIANGINDLQFTKLNGKHSLDSNYIYEDHFETASLIECAKECVNYEQCWSYGYHEANDTCRLVSSNLNETNVEGVDEGWTYFVENCEPGWISFRGSCYKVVENGTSFDEAQSHCTSIQGHLIKIDDEDENIFCVDFIRQTGNNHFWIGLSDEDHEGVWLWYPSMEVPVFTDWNTHEPTSDNTQNCVVIHKQYLKWHDLPCGGKHSFICEAERNWK